MDHPAKAPPLHIKEGKTLWSTWQIDYIGPLKSSAGYKYILTGVEIISGLLTATKCQKANSQNTIRGLSSWFSILPVPDSIQSDNGSHFTSKEVQEWAKQKEIKWVFHTPYYPQSNGIVERANGLLKKYLKPHEGQWDRRLSEILQQLNNRYGPYGSPITRAFLTLSSETNLNNEHTWSSMKAGQPVMAKIPSVGTIPVTLVKPRGFLAWDAIDNDGIKHKISTRWIYPAS